MWRVEFTTANARFLKAFTDLAELHGAPCSVEELEGDDDRLTSALWLAQQVHARQKAKRSTLEEVQSSLRESGLPTLAAVSRMTLEEFLLKAPFYSRLLGIMAEVGVTFADGACPAEFPEQRFKEGEPTADTAEKLLREGIDSWAMLPFLSADFLGDIRNVGHGRIRDIRTLLALRGKTLKGEGN